MSKDRELNLGREEDFIKQQSSEQTHFFNESHQSNISAIRSRKKKISFSSNNMSQLTFAIRMIIGISIISFRQRRSFHEIKSDEEANTLEKDDY